MTKAEAIRNTEYTENELINLALTMAIQQSRAWRNESDVIESWDHYENLMNAFSAILLERQGNEKTKH
jgi:hypothetical protein